MAKKESWQAYLKRTALQRNTKARAKARKAKR